MPNVLQRIACHKQALGGVCSAGIARAHRGNPAASLRVNQLYATPVLLSGLASMVLSEAEVKVMDTYYKNTIQNLQRLHQNTPKGVVFLLAGCLPGNAVLHSRQLSLFSMVCHLPDDPLHHHANHILSFAPPSAKSWFQQIRDICTQYGLPHPLQLLDNPPPKEQFKSEVKRKICDFWYNQFVTETRKLKSLKYFKPELYSLTKPHYMWTSAASNPFECSKSTILARMASGRYRSDMLCRHWSRNRSGFCIAPSCTQTSGTLEHLLVSCPAHSSARERLYQMWLEKSVMFPNLHATIKAILVSPAPTIAQFILEPLAFQLILSDFLTLGDKYAQQLAYMTRTFAFYIHREHQKLLKIYNNPPPKNNNFAQISNFSYFPAVTTRRDDAIPAVSDTTDWGSYPLHVQPVCAVTARPDTSTLAIPCAQHLSPTQDSPTLLQPGPCHGRAPPSTSHTCSQWCNTPTLGTTHAQHSVSDSIVRLNMVTVPTVSTAQYQILAAHHAPDVHDLHPDCGLVGGGGVREEAERILTMANITY